jgi:potassium efflux system protein
MSLAQGSAYATTTLLSYLIMGVGIVTTLSTLGVSWDKLQWLVAALSVGIGFGMQEIIANFISGLIILFERPVRIGDLVTIGNVTGSVNRIRIRATHIVDADRKVVVVPNKTFITDQLINWTLSDTVTRLVLKVGVGYGSDLDLVRRLLYQAAQENVRVMRDPEPLVLFQTFGESTLDHDLIIHVRELGDRGRATDEINRRIDQLFREHSIEIAFRQVDVFVKNLEGQEAQIGHTAALAAAGAATEQPTPPPAKP